MFCSVLHCFRAFYEAKTRGEFEKKEAPAEKPAYWNNSPKHSESEQGANPFLEMKKDVKKQKEVQVNFVKKPLALKIYAPKKYTPTTWLTLLLILGKNCVNQISR